MMWFRTLMLAGLILISGSAARVAHAQGEVTGPPAPVPTPNPTLAETSLVYADPPFPNLISDGMFRMRVSTSAPVVFFVRIKLYGLDVWESPRQGLASGFEGVMIYRIDRTLSSGQYQIVPYVVTPKGETLRAKIASSVPYDSYPVLIP